MDAAYKTNPDTFIKDFLNQTLKDTMSALNAETGSLFLFDSEKKELILDSFYNLQHLDIKGIRQRVGEGVSGKVASFKKPVLVKDINSDSRFQRNGYNHYHTNSFISIPLFSSNGLIGLMNLADKSTGEPFSEKDLEFASLLSHYSCIIAENLLESERLKKERQALDSYKDKYTSVGKLAAGVVHEINNPLDGIIRYANMLLHHINNDTVSREYLLEIKKGLNRIANTTKSFLEFARQVNSNIPKNKPYVDLHEVINESLCIVNMKHHNNIEVIKDFNNALPKILDFGLAHIFINMIKNAIDAMPNGGTLSIATGINENMVKVTIRDTGIGIPQEAKEHIFEPFFTTKSIDRGTGLGLSVSNEIVHKYGGKIDFQSEQEKGTVFTVLIPKNNLEHEQQ